MTGHVDDIFDRNRHTSERKIDIYVLGFVPGGIEINREIRVDFRFDLFDPRAQGLEHFARRDFAAPEQSLQISDRQRRQFRRTHSTTFVTIKSWFAFCGALLSASSAVNQSRGSSSRNTLKIGTACAAASTYPARPF